MIYYSQLSSESPNLNVSLRTHLAEDVQNWARQVLNGEISAAAETIENIFASGFPIYLTRDLEAAKDYVKTRYEFSIDKRYGLIASSKAKNLKLYGMNNEYMATKTVKVHKWFVDDPTSPHSCCQLDTVVTEFGCQGLELDFPIVGWGNDLRWEENHWVIRRTRRNSAKDPFQLRINSYRVLLTRGRDGMIIFVPNEREMDDTFHIIQNSGARVK